MSSVPSPWQSSIGYMNLLILFHWCCFSMSINKGATPMWVIIKLCGVQTCSTVLWLMQKNKTKKRWVAFIYFLSKPDDELNMVQFIFVCCIFNIVQVAASCEVWRRGGEEGACWWCQSWEGLDLGVFREYLRRQVRSWQETEQSMCVCWQRSLGGFNNLTNLWDLCGTSIVLVRLCTALLCRVNFGRL